MANWNKIFSRGNVEDRRSMAPAVGGISLAGVAVLMLLNVMMGGDVTDILSQLESVPIENQAPQDQQQFSGEDNYEVFASTVLGSNNDMWQKIFSANNKTYTPPKLVLFRQATESGCGVSTSRVGPHYCPLDKTIYLDETFFDELTNELTRRFGAQGGDVAEAYVIAHEVAHHAQNELGIMDQVEGSRQNDPEVSVSLELQADCFAGLWANSVKDQEVFEPGEVQEAIDAAAAVGDDRIQERVTGQVNPETWTHGSSEQRVSWFNKGFETGDLNSCDTFR
jgi:uncharacterized protein